MLPDDKQSVSASRAETPPGLNRPIQRLEHLVLFAMNSECVMFSIEAVIWWGPDVLGRWRNSETDRNVCIGSEADVSIGPGAQVAPDVR